MSIILEQQDDIYSRQELEDLFNTTVYPHIVKTGGKIASYYKHKHKEDYEDILQLIAIDIWKVTNKLLLISSDSQSFMRILTSAINFSFRTHYGRLKKTVYIPHASTISLEEFEVEQPSDVAKLDILLDLDDVNTRILAFALGDSRFVNGERKAIEFCLKSLLLGREPGKRIIGAFYNVDDPSFILDYSKYLIRLALVRLSKELGQN